MHEKPMQAVMAIGLVAVSVLHSFFVYRDGAPNANYHRTNAASYVAQYVTTPNPAYYDFSDVGGDCTSFASQALRAGGMPMTRAKANPTARDWYYYASHWGTGRSTSWTNAQGFHAYWAGLGASGAPNAYAMLKFSPPDFAFTETWLDIWHYLEPGDVVQYVASDGVAYHTQVVYRVGYEAGAYTATVGQHSKNGYRSLRSYAVLLPLDTTIYVMKMKAPASINAAMAARVAEEDDTERLAEMEEALFLQKPTTRAAEDEKWEQIAAIKQRLYVLGSAGLAQDTQTVTRDAFQQMLEDRMDANAERAAAASLQTSGRGAQAQAYAQRVALENAVIAQVLAGLEAGEPLAQLWDYYWETVPQHAPPAFFIIP